MLPVSSSEAPRAFTRGPWAVALAACLATGPCDAEASNEAWARTLSRYVEASGAVRYRSLAEEGRKDLESYLDSLGGVKPETLLPDDRVAFWLNAHNALALWAVVSGERTDATTERARFFDWFSMPIAGRNRTLDEIVAILDAYARFDPRIHLARSNGTRSSPAFSRVPFTGAGLERQLAEAAERMCGDDDRVKLDRSAGILLLPRLFSWYRLDFERSAGSLAAFVLSHRTGDAVAAGGTLTIRFRNHDWSLRAAPGEAPRK